MIVAIDGPAGAGKSTVTRMLAEQLGFEFLDTGAMYRAIAWAGLKNGIDFNDQMELQELANQTKIEFIDDQVFVNGDNVTAEIRTPGVTRRVASVADAPEIRAQLVQTQRLIAQDGNFVCEGRDQGTVAFPEAFCKIYLTASPRSRAERRAKQMEAGGDFVDFDQIVREQELRDQQDLNRPVGRLMKADDAIEFKTDHQTLEEVVASLKSIVKARMAELSSH